MAGFLLDMYRGVLRPGGRTPQVLQAPRILLLRVAIGGPCVLLAGLLGCAASTSPGQPREQSPEAVAATGAPELPGPGLTLPSPSHFAGKLGLPGRRPAKRSSYVEADLTQNGADFDTTLPYNHAAPDGSNVDLTPGYTPGGPLSGLAYCTYLFNVNGYDRNNQVRLAWSIAPGARQDFVGLANWNADRWDWYPCSAVGWANTGPMSNYFDFAHNLLAVVAVEGGSLCVLSAIRLGGLPPVPSVSASPSTGAVPITVHLDASASTTPDGTITKYEWDFNGDGVIEQDTGTTPTVDHLYSSGGDINATVRVTNSLGASATASTPLQLTGPWTHTLGKSQAEDLEATAWDFSQNIYATGYVHEIRVTGEVDLLLLTKWSPTGNLLWAKTWESGFKGAFGRAVQVDSDGNIIVAGDMRLDNNELRAFLQKWGPDGTLLWSYQYYDPVTAHAGFSTLKVDGTDSYVAGYGPFYQGESVPLVMKLDSGGAPQWESVYQTVSPGSAVDSALRWTIFTGTNAFFVLVKRNAVPPSPALMEFGLDGTLEAAKYYSGMSDGIDPRGLTLTQDSFNYHTDIYVAGVQISAGKSGAFLTSCDGNYSVEHQNAWFGSSNASVNKIMFGAANDVYLAGFMPGLDAGSTYGMLWRFSTADGSLLSSEYWGNGTHRGAFYNLGWYQSGMLLMGVADDVNATWNTLIGNTSTPSGSWSDYFGALVTTSLSVDSIAGAVSDFTGYTKDTGGGGFDALMMWRTMS